MVLITKTLAQTNSPTQVVDINYDLDHFFNTKLSELNGTALDIVTEGFTFPSEEATVHTALSTLLTDAPVVTSKGLYFFGISGDIVAHKAIDLSQFDENETPSVQEARLYATSPEYIADRATISTEDLEDAATSCLQALPAMPELDKRGNPLHYICGFNYRTCKSYKYCNKEWAGNSSNSKCSCISYKRVKTCLTTHK